MNQMKAFLEKSINKVEKWIEENDYKGHEPFDALNSFFAPMTSFHPLFTRIFIQSVRQSPINLRPLLGIKKTASNPGRGLMAAGYLIKLKLTNDLEYERKVRKSLDWLMRNKSPLYPQHSWGNRFSFVSRGGNWPINESSIVWSSHIGLTFLDAYEILGENKYLDVARDVCEWILKLPREKTDTGICLSYHAFTQSSIHNANMLGAAMLARTGKYTGEKALFELAKSAMQYSCSRQLKDGGWYYAEESNAHWIDNFHTGYNLDSLKIYMDNSNDRDFSSNIDLGFTYFIRTFFEKDHIPKYYHNRTFPIDIQCAAQAIDTLALFSEYDNSSLKLASSVAKWTIDNMQDKRGYFYYRILPYGIKAKIPMFHWGQATMYKALVHLMSKL